MFGRKPIFRKLIGGSFICWLIFSFSVSAQEAVVPIAYSNYLLGGAKNGKWLTAQEVAPILEKKVEFAAVGLKGVAKNSAIFGDKGEEFGACPDVSSVNFSTEKELALMVGTNAKWNLVPRVPQPIALTDATRIKTIAEFLQTKNIGKTNVKITQAFVVDLDGDGQKEIIYAGNYYQKGMVSGQHRGDYSFVLVRKNVKGKWRNILLEGEFFTVTGDEYAPPNQRDIAAVADLNGDGTMEIVLHTSYYEGDWVTVYQMKDDQLAKVLEVECGL